MSEVETCQITCSDSSWDSSAAGSVCTLSEVCGFVLSGPNRLTRRRGRDHDRDRERNRRRYALVSLLKYGPYH